MGLFNFTSDIDWDSIGKNLVDTIEKQQYEDIESEYISQLEKMKSELSNLDESLIPDYVKSMDETIEYLKHKVINIFSFHNKHLTEEYMDQNIKDDTILTIELFGTTKDEDIFQYLKAQEHYINEYKDMLNNIPHVWKLSPAKEATLLRKGLIIAELRFLAKQTWIII